MLTCAPVVLPAWDLRWCTEELTGLFKICLCILGRCSESSCAKSLTEKNISFDQYFQLLHPISFPFRVMVSDVSHFCLRFSEFKIVNQHWSFITYKKQVCFEISLPRCNVKSKVAWKNFLLCVPVLETNCPYGQFSNGFEPDIFLRP